ncbi:hypothetical protein FQN50_004858 [Emmonsiellopsis sp. PD_5]|nr:hypothetical protein FQN50_004858 [Emmonsiellopsis sp. PD_5]
MKNISRKPVASTSPPGAAPASSASRPTSTTSAPSITSSPSVTTLPSIVSPPEELDKETLSTSVALYKQHSRPGSYIQPNSPPSDEPFPTLEIPTNKPEITSGFPYNQKLFQLHVAPDEWTQFSDELIHASRLSTLEKCAVWTVGVGVGLVSTTLAPGYYSAKAMRNSRIAKKVERSQKGEGELETTLRNWNEGVFQNKGFRVWLRLPREKQAKIDGSPVDKKTKKDKKKDSKKDAKGKDEDENASNRSDSLPSSTVQPDTIPTFEAEKQGSKVEPKESRSAKKKREKKEAKALERHFTLMIEDIRKPVSAEELLQVGVVKIEDGGDNTPRAPSSQGNPPEYTFTSQGNPVELEETSLSYTPSSVLNDRGIHEMSA